MLTRWAIDLARSLGLQNRAARFVTDWASQTGSLWFGRMGYSRGPGTHIHISPVWLIYVDETWCWHCEHSTQVLSHTIHFTTHFTENHTSPNAVNNGYGYWRCKQLWSNRFPLSWSRQAWNIFLFFKQQRNAAKITTTTTSSLFSPPNSTENPKEMDLPWLDSLSHHSAGCFSIFGQNKLFCYSST